ncbi:formimidoylglutamase [Arenibacter sp. 6A1]|uniref:formimidoylglutamase n=1 Tax=Arenibacter sp. 6A1 TaxID=2720391 RepID=UPI0014455525|nr:formimidoylglutamase [Arenibacter sp. 6A1]NKI26035.1 formimidoylglutamase [Arenibacter sp. 6A1]
MAFDFLVPVSEQVLDHCEQLPSQALGRHINKHTARYGLPELETVHLAILGVNESRNALETKSERLDLSQIRLQLYALMKGNWNTSIVDLGDIEEGNSIADTYFVVKEVVAQLLKDNIVPVVIGATQDITYATYRAFDGLKEMVNLVAIDSRFDFGMDENIISTHSYMSKIITDKPNNLFNFSNIGYQSYFNSQEEIDLMDRLFFDAYRLGEIISDISLAEPVLRNANLVSMDARAIRSADIGYSDSFSPNGFTGREICAIARYAGISEKVSVFGIYEIENSNQSFQLMAQIIWYFIEGVNFRIVEEPTSESNDFSKYTVPTEDRSLVFFKSHLTERWWVEVPSVLSSHTKIYSPALLPCTKADYLEACNQNIPERWFKAYKKGFN